jgi:hypothetical protein
VRRLKRKRVTRERSADESGVGAHLVLDALATGRGVRALTIVDSYTREWAAIEIGAGMAGCWG